MNYPDLSKVEFLGDVHLGRRFIEGVPLDRRGDRELMVRDQFVKELRAHNGDYHVQVGDLFDSFDVPNELVLHVADIYRKAAHDLQGCTFIILRGNHDASRNSLKASSFQVFKELVRGVPNIRVIDTPTVIDRIGFMPWDPFMSAEQQAQQLVKLAGGPTGLGEHFKLDAVVCHCDVKHYGGDTFNVLPAETLRSLTGLVVTGHDHTKRTINKNYMVVRVTGSMQPYSHGEDPDHTMYLTLSTEELRDIKVDLTNKYVRVMLRPGEDAPAAPNCLGFKTQLLGAKEEESDITVEFESFDTVNLFKGILEELKVSPDFSKLVMDKFQEQLNA